MKPIGICTHCGAKCLTTRDHVPPRSIFPVGVRSNVNFITVPACTKCNNGAKVDDEEFKVFISLCCGMDSDSRNLLLESVQRTVAKNAKLKREIIGNAFPIYLPTKGWPSYRKAYSLGWNTQAFQRVMARIIRGLYYTQYKVRLPNEIVIATHFLEDIPGKNIPQFEAFFERFASGCGRGKISNKNEFVYLYGKLKDNDFGTFWTFIFYERLQVFGFTGPN